MCSAPSENRISIGRENSENQGNHFAIIVGVKQTPLDFPDLTCIIFVACIVFRRFKRVCLLYCTGSRNFVQVFRVLDPQCDSSESIKFHFLAFLIWFSFGNRVGVCFWGLSISKLPNLLLFSLDVSENAITFFWVDGCKRVLLISLCNSEVCFGRCAGRWNSDEARGAPIVQVHRLWACFTILNAFWPFSM